MQNKPSPYFVVVVLVFLFCFTPSASRAQEQQTVPQENRLFESAQADWNNQQWDQAVVKYRQFLQLYPNHPLAADAHFQVGYYLSYIASPEEAIAEYEQTIAMAPGTHDAHEAKVGIAALKFWQQDFEGAYELFRQVVVETEDWAMIKECVFRMKELGRLIQLQKLPEQRSAMVDCGPRALELIFEKKHIKTSDKEMEKLIVLGHGGATMEQLKEAAESKGLGAWGVKVNAEQLASLPGPFIVHIRPDHFVVVTHASKEKIEFTDPHRGDTYRTREKFQRIWQGYALVFAKDIPAKLRPQLLTRTEMEAIHGGHHLHGMNLGPPDGNPASKFDRDPNSCSGPGLPHWSVNMSNYNFLVQDTDFSYSGRGPSVGLTRVYNADDPREGVFGRSWTFNYEVFLTVSPNGSVDVKREGGKVDNFVSRGDGTFDPPRWIHDRLIKNADGTYRLELKNSKVTEFFNAQGKLAQITDRNNNSVTLQYDTGNRLISVTDAVGRITQFTYNAAGKISQVTDPIGRKAIFSYDANHNLVSTVDMAGNVSSFTYNGASYMTSLTTPNGTTQVHMGTTPHFTEFSALLKEIVDPLGNTTRYDTGDFIAWVFDARGNQTFYFNDSLGQTTEIEDPLGNKTKSSFNTTSGDLTQITDANGNITNLTYDSRGNVTSITDALGNSISFTYDIRDNLTQSVDPLNGSYSYQYDPKDNLVKVIDPKSGITTFAYDGSGLLTASTDSRGNTTTFAYDVSGNLKTVTNPTGGINVYSYDGVGRLSSSTDPKGQTFSYTYDGIDRLTRIQHPGGALTTYSYSCCTLSSITDPSGTLNFVYDSGNRLTQYTDSRGRTIKYGYDSNRNLTTLTYPDGKVVRYDYDAANRLTKVSDWVSNTTTYSYDSSGRLISVVNSNGTVTGYQYDLANRLTSLTNAKSNGVILSAYRYAMNALGNRTNNSAIDPVSSILSSRSVNTTYDNDNRIQTVAGAGYAFDANGNLTTTQGSVPTNYSYDIFNRLTQVALSGYSAQYQYNALGERISRTVNGTTVNYVVDPNGSASEVLAETDAAGNNTAFYVYGLGLISKVTASGQTYYYHYDGLGNTVSITDSAGLTVNNYAYDSFGKVLNQSEGIPNSFKYLGRFGVMDEANGLLYMKARYYDSSNGRFINKDPIGLMGGSNMYAYSGNNPVTYLDPSGLDWLQNLTDFSAGFGDTVSFGLTKWIRQQMGTDDMVNPCSGWYSGGEWTGVAWGAAFEGLVIARAAGWTTRIALHGPHHEFGSLGKLSHIQINWWKIGVKGSGGAFRIPVPFK